MTSFFKKTCPLSERRKHLRRKSVHFALFCTAWAVGGTLKSKNWLVLSHHKSVHFLLNLACQRPVNRDGHIRAKHKSSSHMLKYDSLLQHTQLYAWRECRENNKETNKQQKRKTNNHSTHTHTHTRARAHKEQQQLNEPQDTPGSWRSIQRWILTRSTLFQENLC